MSTRSTNHAPAAVRGRSGSTTAAAQMPQSSHDATAPAPALTLETTEQSDTERLARLLQDFGSVDGFTARIERVRTSGVAAELCGYLGSMMFGDEFLEDVRHEHGGGKFRARIYDARGGYKTSFPFAIAGTPKRPGESTAAPVGVGPASAAGMTNSAEPSRLERMIESLAATVAALAESVRHAAAPRDSSSSIDQVVSVARALKELAPPAPPAPAQSTMEALEMFFTLQDRLDERAPRGGDDGFGKIVEHGVKPIANLMSRSLDLQERQLLQRQRPVAVVSPPAAAPIGELPTAGDDTAAAAAANDDSGITQLAQSIPAMARSYLANAAKQNRDAASYATIVLDTIEQNSAQLYAALPHLLGREDFAAELLAHVAQWAPYPEWFAELFAEMRAQLSDPDAGVQVESESTGAGGAAGDEAA